MICPSCTSIIPQIDTELLKSKDNKKMYQHQCTRCFCTIQVTIETLEEGRPELVTKYKNWLNEK